MADLILQPNSYSQFDPLQYAELASSPWLHQAAGFRASLKDMIRAASSTQAHQTPATAVTLEIDQGAPAEGEIINGNAMRFQIMTAIRVLVQPLYVIVEDETSDGGFILWMARLLKKDVIRTAYNAGRLSFKHAGGKNQMEKAARALSFGIWPRPERPLLRMKLRCVALLDSDSRFAGHQPNAGIKTALNEYVSFTHILQGRMIENYVPKRFAKDRLKDQSDALDAYFRLTEEQRMFFPLKTGFRDKGVNPKGQSKEGFEGDAGRLAEEIALFASVTASEWTKFSGGFGATLGDVYSERKHRCNPGEVELLTLAQRAESATLLARLINHL